MRRCSHSAHPSGRLNRQRLQAVRLEVQPRFLPLCRLIPNARPRGYHEHGQVIALAVFRVQDVIAQAQPLVAMLPAEAEGMQRGRRSGRKKLEGVAIALSER